MNVVDSVTLSDPNPSRDSKTLARHMFHAMLQGQLRSTSGARSRQAALGKE